MIMKHYFYPLLISLLLSTAGFLPAQDALITPVEPEVNEPEAMMELKLTDDTALQVIDMLEQMTNKIILRRQDISPAKISIDTRGPISKRDAVLALESLLTLNGIMLTDMGGRFMKAVPATDVNRHVPQMLIGSTLGMAPSQQIYAKLFKFNYLNAEQISGTLIQPLLSQNSGFIPFPKSNALLITDALINLQRVENIIAEADRPESLREEMKFVKLNFIQASEAQGQIENLIQGPLKSYLEGNTAVTADERTNQLLLITHPGNISIIMDVIKNIDVDAAPLTSSEVFQLRQAKAEEVVPIIEGIISGQAEGREKDAEVARDNKRQNNPNTPAEGIPNQPAPNPPASAAATTSDTNASLQFSNFVGLSADERTNAIVAYGTQQDLKTLKELIEKIDIPLPQVRIEAIITEVTLNENQSSGITALGFEVLPDGNVSFGGSVQTGIDGSGNPINSLGGIIGTGFTLNGTTSTLEGLTALFSASDSDSNSRILQTPTIVVSHNEEGTVNVSESRPIVTSSSSTLDNNNANVRSNVEFRDIGIQLTVTPLIGADGSVQMTIEQTVDSIIGEIDIDGNSQPIIGRREATSTITVNSGEMIILGGLQENQKSESKSYFPLFGRLPLVKNILGGSSTDFTRRDLVIFIRPTVINSPESAEVMTQEKLKIIESSDEVSEFVETGKIGRTYMEGSKFEAKPTPTPTPAKEDKTSKQRSLRR